MTTEHIIGGKHGRAGNALARVNYLETILNIVARAAQQQWMRGSGTEWGGQGLLGVQQGCRTFVETLVRRARAFLGRGRSVAYVCADGACLG